LLNMPLISRTLLCYAWIAYQTAYLKPPPRWIYGCGIVQYYEWHKQVLFMEMCWMGLEALGPR
jgi:hypothetical protein